VSIIMATFVVEGVSIIWISNIWLGHCNLHNKKRNMKKLGCWVENQRTLYKRLINNPASQCLSKERVDKLNEIGFRWSMKPIEEPVFVTEKKICKIEKTQQNDNSRTLLQDAKVKNARNIQQTTIPVRMRTPTKDINTQGVKRSVETSSYKPTLIQTVHPHVSQHDRVGDLALLQHQRRHVYTHRPDIPVECGQRFMPDMRVQSTKFVSDKRIRLSSSVNVNTWSRNPMPIRSPFNFREANLGQSVITPHNFQHRPVSQRIPIRMGDVPNIVYKVNSVNPLYRGKVQRYNSKGHPSMGHFEFYPKR